MKCVKCMMKAEYIYKGSFVCRMCLEELLKQYDEELKKMEEKYETGKG